jgi:hypothetical protein
MADWFVVVDAQGTDDPRPAQVFECVDYRAALVLAGKLADGDPDLSVEVVDYEGRVLMALGLDEWDGTQGRTVIPLKAGIYRWQDASETYRLVRY